MQDATVKKIENQRKFVIGVVGASANEINSLSRIFSVTDFRSRRYEPKMLEINAFKRPINVDFILMCSGNPQVIEAWKRSHFSRSTDQRPMVYLARMSAQKFGTYQINSPVNPSRLIKILDYYTIKELNYLPEFEIGSESNEIPDNIITGLKILRSNVRGSSCQEEEKKVLVVDDSLAVRRQMQIEFQLRHDHLEVAKDAEEALLAIDRQKYDLIFLDVVMPGMDGYTACKKIKKSRLNYATPIILLTSRSSSFDRIKGTLARCDAYLVKPINHNEFETVYKKFTDTTIVRGQAHAS